ncbi:amino acid adenylation domain-containing protein [Streptomyces sp. NPDC127051]|uniref:amino acid adenylation domain-containing protein n=1 Tax=Streptomyces sp. NPDC127051 TaxID=3347119 RepID=UPI00366571E0
MTPPRTPAPAYRRPVSPTEHLYLSAGHARGSMALRIVVEGHTAPEPAALRAAVTRAAETCPGSRLVRRGPLWTAEGPLPAIRYAAPAAGAIDVSDPATAALLTGRSRRGDPPGCEVLVIPGTSSVAPATLVFSASHALMDGHGALIWVREVFRALRGEPGRPARAPDTDRGLLRRLGATARRPALAPAHPSPLGRPAPGPEQTLWLRRTLPGHHPALTARLAQALTDSATTGGTRVMIPVDLRRHRPGIAATGNLTLPVFLDLSPGQEWPRAQVTLLRALAENQELAEGFESALLPLPPAATGLLLRAAQAGTVRADRHLASAVVSHLGRLDPAEFSGGGFTATTLYALPVHAPLVPVSVAATETDTATELTMGVRGGPGLAVRATRLLDEVLTHLPTSAAPAPAPAPAPVSASVPPTAVGPEPAAPTAPPPPAQAARTPGEPAPAAAPAPGSVPPPATVVQLFRAQAARTPAAPALDGPDGVVTYAELDRRSDAVAAELLRRGIDREDLVGLVVDRTPAGVCALWGILKAGAAYVPLDPAHPAARTAEILRARGARLCLTQRHLAEALGALAPCKLLLAEDLATAPPHLPVPPAPAPEDLAYVIHTSGSTGRPKGVQIEHRSLTGFVRWMTQVCRVDARTRFGFASSYGFDISCFPLFLPLLAGGTVVLAPDAPSRATLRRLVTDHRADTLALTPSHLALLPDQGDVRTLLLGGEPLTPAAVRTARTAFGPDCRIINGYGPTETTVVCLAHVVDDARPTTAATLPIGTPGPYAHIHLVTEDGDRIGTGPRDIGRTGEIVVSGPQVARGYLGPPDGRPSPFAEHEDGTRTYRTGDLGRRLPGGAVEFAGRIDGQLKIAGHRIEPAEIVAALEALPEVSRAVVAVRRRPHTTTPVLCAYVVPRPGGPYGTLPHPANPGGPGSPQGPANPNDPGPPHAPDLPATLRSALAALLPAAMVPAHVITVDAIPSTVTGKADLDALPDPFAVPPAPAPAHDTAEPATTLQARVAAHWSAILAVDPARLSTESDFQTLGGDSLALVEMLTAVSEDLLEPAQARRFMAGLDCLVRNLTLAQVCAHLTAAREELPA